MTICNTKTEESIFAFLFFLAFSFLLRFIVLFCFACLVLATLSDCYATFLRLFKGCITFSNEHTMRDAVKKEERECVWELSV